MGKIILVTGGARSGKSKFAEELALKLGDGRAAYIATAQIFDEEMAYRVKIHKERRGANWLTFESPFNADKSISFAAKTFNVILFDCVTIYLSNFICAADLDNEEKTFSDFNALIDNLISAAKNSDATVIFVSNEVGGGIVPENKLARHFRDMAGLANQKIASVADNVYMTIAGLVVDIKSFCVNRE